MINEKGSISINTENILPIIKKWLYSDKDIFIRELIANGCDAITKFKKLISLGEAAPCDDAYAIMVSIDKQAGTLRFSDNGIGMNADEVKKYINQVAFSGAEDFVKKYEQAGSDAIIGHFGLGFYSSFMVADKVQVQTLSYQKDADAVCWTSDGESGFELSEGLRTERGTDITLHLNESDKEFLEIAEVRKVIEKYCAFLPIPIFLEDLGAEIEKKDGEEQLEEIKPLNDIAPLWQKSASECTDEEYKAFYQKVFNTYKDPLFWIHLNVDYPFNLKGILYFPEMSDELNSYEGQIKLYNNQVYVADNIKEVIPEFLMLLKGVIDCPDLPLNVSRSFLQNDGTVKRMQTHITKKVADKLKAIFNTEREKYNQYWKDINPFIKFGAIKDDKFYDQIKDALIFEKLDGEFFNLEELIAYAKENGGKIYYVSDKSAQGVYMDLYKAQGEQAIMLDGTIDNHFISMLEYKLESVTFGRIDSELAQSIKGEYIDMPDKDKLEALMKSALGLEKLDLEVAPLKTDSLPAILVIDESMRRFAEMSSRFGGKAPFDPNSKLILNGSSSIIKKLANSQGEKAELVASYVYDIALLSKGMLTAEQTKGFVERSAKVFELLNLD